MVKIPGLDDLKKMGTGLIDSAKTVNLSGVMDKLKSGVDSVAKGKQPPTAEQLGSIYQAAHITMAEILTLQANQTELVKKLQNQLIELGTVVENLQKPATPEEKKSNE